jgi:hypothetical protein
LIDLDMVSVDRSFSRRYTEEMGERRRGWERERMVERKKKEEEKKGSQMGKGRKRERGEE